MAADEGPPVDLAGITVDDFAPLLGSSFMIVDAGDAEISLSLTEAQPGRPDPDPTARQPFALVFLGPTQPILEQAIHALSHETLGRLEIFIVPIGADETGVRYEAVFS
jgi:hypothetical protein